MRPTDARTTVVIATRDRAANLAGTLERLVDLPERPPIVVVDNGSTDGTVATARRHGRQVTVLELSRNVAAAARTVGVRAAATPYVAFSDDDSWWAAGALARAERYFDRHHELGLLAARLLVGPSERLDPVVTALRSSPVATPAHLPGRAILGFVACGAAVRRRAYLGVGGFQPRLGIGGEESLLAADLAAAGWALLYADDVVAHHWPAAGGRGDRGARLVRNRCWSAWLRRPAGPALRETARAAHDAVRDRQARHGLVAAAAGLPWTIDQRQVVPAAVEAGFRALESQQARARWPRA